MAEAEADAKRQADIDAEATRRSEAASRAKEAARAEVNRRRLQHRRPKRRRRQLRKPARHPLRQRRRRVPLRLAIAGRRFKGEFGRRRGATGAGTQAGGASANASSDTEGARGGGRCRGGASRRRRKSARPIKRAPARSTRAPLAISAATPTRSIASRAMPLRTAASIAPMRQGSSTFSAGAIAAAEGSSTSRVSAATHHGTGTRRPGAAALPIGMAATIFAEAGSKRTV